MTIARELEARLFELADPKTKWVQDSPRNPGEQCLVVRYPEGGVRNWQVPWEIETSTWLREFVSGYADGMTPTGFNDRVAKSRDEVLWMLQEAIDQARWEGV